MSAAFGKVSALCIGSRMPSSQSQARLSPVSLNVRNSPRVLRPPNIPILYAGNPTRAIRRRKAERRVPVANDRELLSSELRMQHGLIGPDREFLPHSPIEFDPDLLDRPMQAVADGRTRGGTTCQGEERQRSEDKCPFHRVAALDLFVGPASPTPNFERHELPTIRNSRAQSSEIVSAHRPVAWALTCAGVLFALEYDPFRLLRALTKCPHHQAASHPGTHDKPPRRATRPAVRVRHESNAVPHAIPPLSRARSCPSHW
jgi:hypothetical protein